MAVSGGTSEATGWRTVIREPGLYIQHSRIEQSCAGETFGTDYAIRYRDLQFPVMAEEIHTAI